MTIGTILKKNRLLRGESLEEVAFRAGMDAGNLSRVERDMQDVTVPRLVRLCSALELSVADVFAEYEGLPPHKRSPHMARDARTAFDSTTGSLLAITDKLDPTGLRLLTRIAGIVKDG